MTNFVKATIVKETEKAVLVSGCSDVTVWLPKSQVTIYKEKTGSSAFIEIPDFINERDGSKFNVHVPEPIAKMMIAKFC